MVHHTQTNQYYSSPVTVSTRPVFRPCMNTFGGVLFHCSVVKFSFVDSNSIVIYSIFCSFWLIFAIRRWDSVIELVIGDERVIEAMKLTRMRNWNTFCNCHCSCQCFMVFWRNALELWIQVIQNSENSKNCKCTGGFKFRQSASLVPEGLTI